MGGRRASFELIGYKFDIDVVERFPKPLAAAVYWIEMMCRRREVFAQRLQEGLGDTFNPALTEANRELSRERSHTARLIQYLANGCF